MIIAALKRPSSFDIEELEAGESLGLIFSGSLFRQDLQSAILVGLLNLKMMMMISNSRP
jgi:hypothetical protein